jgi:P27 family predicted phage terminase small subunit
VRCPGDIPDDAKRHWRKYAPRLYRLGLLTELDLPPFKRYCELFSEYRAKKQLIAEKGEYYPIYATPTKAESKANAKPRLAKLAITPYARQLPGIRDELLRLEKDFGMTPASRSGIEVSPALSEADEVEERLFGSR